MFPHGDLEGLEDDLSANVSEHDQGVGGYLLFTRLSSREDEEPRRYS